MLEDFTDRNAIKVNFAQTLSKSTEMNAFSRTMPNMSQTVDESQPTTNMNQNQETS